MLNLGNLLTKSRSLSLASAENWKITFSDFHPDIKMRFLVNTFLAFVDTIFFAFLETKLRFTR